MRISLGIIVLLVFACAPKVGVQKELFSEDVLLKMVSESLQIDQSTIHFYDIKTYTENSNEVFLVLAEEEVTADIDRTHFTSHLIIANSISGKVKYRLSESSDKNGWISDAIFLDEIRIDTIQHQLSDDQKGFGVIAKFRNNSQVNPYTQEVLSLFIKENTTLKKVVDSYVVFESNGEVNANVDSCEAHFKITENQLSTVKNKSMHYYDLLIKSTTTERTFGKDKNGDCNPTEITKAKSVQMLKFNGVEYN